MNIMAISKNAENDYSMAQRPPGGRAYKSTSRQPYSYDNQLAPYRGQQLVPPDQAEVDALSISQKAYQNAEGIRKYQKNDTAVIYEGPLAAAVNQLFENDLHNMPKVKEVPKTKGTKNKAEESPDRFLYDVGEKATTGITHDSEMTVSFDPVKDLHTWTMWRTAVNGRIVDEVRTLERIKKDRGSNSVDFSVTGVYGRTLMVPPLKQFVKFESDETKAMLEELSHKGQGRLLPQQFVYFGLPRVSLAQNRRAIGASKFGEPFPGRSIMNGTTPEIQNGTIMAIEYDNIQL